jgi:hypothetical protein
MPTVFLDGEVRPLLVLHALAAFALVGAATHRVIVSIQLLRGRAHLGRLARVYAQVIGGTFVGTFAVGLLMYPHYRYFVRGLYLDRYAQWASNLFDIKENIAALALPAALGLFFVGRHLEPKADAALLPFFTFLSVMTWAAVVVTAVSGLVVTGVRGI